MSANITSKKDQNQAEKKIEQLSKELQEITALYNLGIAIESTLDIEEVLWKLYKESSRLIDTSNFAIALLDPENSSSLNFILIVGQEEELAPFKTEVSKSSGLTHYILTTQNPLLIQDLPQTENSFEIEQVYPGHPIRSWLGVPILNRTQAQNSTQGLIAVWSHKPNLFTDHDLWLLSSIGTQAAIAIRNAQLFEASRQRASTMTALHKISQRHAFEMAMLNDMACTLSSTLDFREVLIRIINHVDDLIEVEWGYLLLMEKATGDLVFQQALGNRGKEIKPFRILTGQGVAGHVALTGEAIMIREADEDQLSPIIPQLKAAVRNILCVPLLSHGEVIGVLGLVNKLEDDFTESDLKLISSMASFATIALQNAQLHENVLSERDRVIDAGEQARRELARNLHDGPTQLVSAITMRLEYCKMLLEKAPDQVVPEINRAQELSEQAVHEIRTLLFELRPLALETQGLVAALRIFLERRQKDIGNITELILDVKSATSSSKGEIFRQEEKVEAAIFAIIQEAVNNALKHAEAEHIKVQLNETPKALYITVVDDGSGFDVQQVMDNYEQRGSLGMLNIRERAELIGGELKIKSVPDQGTRIQIRVPKMKEERIKKRKTGPLSPPPGMRPE